MVNVAMLLDRAARQHGSRDAVAHGDRRLTYAELGERVARLAAALRHAGLPVGARVGILQHNGIPLLESLLACFHAGLVAVPVNARSTAHEVSVLAADSEPAAWVYDESYAGHVETVGAGIRIGTAPGFAPLDVESLIAATAERPPPADLDATSPAWLFYTSGTTGRMKGATLTHRNLLAMIQAFLSDVAGYSADDHVLHAAPLTHGSGLYALPPIARGASQVLTTASSYDPDEVLDRIEREKVTSIAFLAPTMVNRMVEAYEASSRDIRSLSNVVYGGAPMYVDDIKRALTSIGGVFTQIYGQAEAPVTVSRLSREEHVAAEADGGDRLMSAGTPYTSVDVAVATVDGSVQRVGTGEVLVRGDVVMKGYWANPEATAETLAAGWLHTGDVGRLDELGYLYLLDRNKDVIISGGANIYPREVEEVILEHPLVREVAVVGAPDPAWGERVVAVISLHRDDPAARERIRYEIELSCRTRLSGYKLPRQIDWVDALPKSPYGKILKREVRDMYWQGHDRHI